METSDNVSYESKPLHQILYDVCVSYNAGISPLPDIYTEQASVNISGKALIPAMLQLICYTSSILKIWRNS